MIKKLNFPKIIERYVQYLTLHNGKKYELKWKTKVLIYITCGANSMEVECLEFISDSLIIREVIANDVLGESVSLEKFNTFISRESLDFKCNCHGFTFANGKFFITNTYVQAILEDEFIEVTNQDEIEANNFEVVCFKDKSTLEWVHSTKYSFELFIHKAGLRKFSAHSSLNEILSLQEYQNSSIHYFKRKQKNCPGICLNAVGEKHFKPYF